MLTPNDVRTFRILAVAASFGLPGLGHVISSRTLAAFAWMSAFLVVALGQTLSVIPAPAFDASSLVGRFPFLAPSVLLLVRLASALELLFGRPKLPDGPNEWRRVAVPLYIFVACSAVVGILMQLLVRR